MSAHRKSADTLPDPFAGRTGAGEFAAGGSLEARLLRRLLIGLGNPPVEFILSWSGERVVAAAPAADTLEQVRIADRSTLLGLLLDPQLRFGDGYAAGRITVDGDLVRFLITLFAAGAPDAPASLLRRVSALLHRPGSNTRAGSRDNIHRHYDIGNDFYASWLGATMAYTCAYYATAAATLDEAQVAKMDHVCRKLRIAPGDSVVEAGCGWGSLAIHMATRYGARVRAFNISREQVSFARERARELGVADRIEFIEDDYRNISGTYAVFVSVGMLEHVGPANYHEFGRVIQRTLAADGRGLIHSIGRNAPGTLHPWIERRIFPGACPPALSQMMQIFEPAGLSVFDVENLRLHYALTLRHWLGRYEAALAQVRARFDESFVRTWRLYLAGSIAAFETGTLQLFQVVFARERNNALPLTRDHLYPR